MSRSFSLKTLAKRMAKGADELKAKLKEKGSDIFVG
jgi:hypothetical protein